MKKIIQTIFLSFLFLILFVILTFPYSRLGPKLQTTLEKFLSSAAGSTINCNLDDFDLKFPNGVKWSALNCRSGSSTFLDIANGSLTFFPGQTLQGKIGKGQLKISTNFGIKSNPNRVSAEFESVPLDRIGSMIFNFVKIPFVSKDLQLLGALKGKMDIPLKNFSKEPGMVDLTFQDFSLPPQVFLKNLGLKELSFSKSVVKLNLQGGKLTVGETAFLSQHLSAKADGHADLQDEIIKSTAALNLKWKIQKSDAMMTSTLGMILNALPCPSPDSEGFCTRRITRLQELVGI